MNEQKGRLRMDERFNVGVWSEHPVVEPECLRRRVVRFTRIVILYSRPRIAENTLNTRKNNIRSCNFPICL